MSYNSETLCLLVIEDNPGDFLLIEDYLREEIVNPAILHVVTFAQARQQIAATSVLDAILLDLSLPDSQGEKLVKDIIQLAGSVPVIVLTGFVDKSFGIHTLSLGVADYLIKDDLTAPQLYKSIVYSMERKRISLQLNESEEKYRSLFHLSPIPMWVFDMEDKRFLNVNEAAIRHYDYSKEEFLSMTIEDIRPQEDLPQLEETMNQIKDLSSPYQCIVRHQKKNGESIQVEIQSNSIEFEKRKARLVLANDITERLNYMHAIEEQNAKLQEIAWIQSHVVRAPLARIMGIIELITNHPTQEIENTELLNYLLDSANELDNVIRAIVAKAEK